MHVSYHKEDSRHLGRPMEFKRYGHAGRPVIVFPTSKGRFYQFEDTGSVAALASFIDAGQIQLAVDNLLANAKKYAPGGAPYGVRVARDGAGTLISVKDSGPGVARRDQKRIFAPFERADDRLSRATEGSGIGLSLVAHVAKAHGGRAWVESAPGQGATFHLWIESPLQ